MEISRREFLKYLGITTAGASLAGLGLEPIWSVPEKLVKRVGGAPLLESWKTSVCSLCPAGCGIKVRLIDGIPVRILGNPQHPVNRGGLCPMGEAGIETLFDPDRIKKPRKRVGDRGSNEWADISWDEALQLVVSRLQEVRSKNAAHKVAFFVGSGNDLLAPFIRRFMHVFGSNNIYVFGAHDEMALPRYLTQGHRLRLAYRFHDLDLLVNFGSDLLDTCPAPIRFNRLYSELRNPTVRRHAKIIHIDSRLSPTASVSHEWLPVEPGTMAALALAVANVLIRDGQYDAQFVKENSFGFEDWTDRDGNPHQGFKSLVAKEYSPAKVAEITGLPAARIVALARDLGNARNALVVGGSQSSGSSNGVYTLWAIECLNALKGNFTANGAFVFALEPPFTPLPEARLDAQAKAGLANPALTAGYDGFCFPETATSSLPQLILESEQPPFDVLFLANTNPLFHAINQPRFLQALKKTPFVVSFAPNVDDTNVYADLILPDHVFLEKYEVVHSVPTVEFAHLGLQQPVIEPLYETRHAGDSLLLIAQQMGGAIAASFPWQSYKEYLQYSLQGVYKTGRGTIFTERMDESWLEYLKKRGWQFYDYSTFDGFWDTLGEQGGWWDPFPQETDFARKFATPSKKFEFYSQLLRERVLSRAGGGQATPDMLEAVLQKWRIEARGDRVFLPHYEPLAINANSGQYALFLLPYHLITNINGSGSNLPLVQELFGMLTRNYWKSWIEMNPKTAHEHGIADGDWVKVSSGVGSFEVTAKLRPGIVPGVVCIPFGLGHKAYGRYAQNIGVNPYELLTEIFDPLGGQPSLISTKVNVQKVQRKERA